MNTIIKFITEIVFLTRNRKVKLIENKITFLERELEIMNNDRIFDKKAILQIEAKIRKQYQLLNNLKRR